jgi:hypothetical protein
MAVLAQTVRHAINYETGSDNAHYRPQHVGNFLFCSVGLPNTTGQGQAV